MNRSSRIILGLCLLAAILGTAWGKEASKTRLHLNIATDKTVYTAKDNPAIAITILNNSRKDCTLRFSSSKQFDVELYDHDNKLIGTMLQNLMFAQAFSSLKLRSQQPLTFVYVWDWHDLKAFPLTPGKYKLIATLETTDKKWLSKPLEIEFR